MPPHMAAQALGMLMIQRLVVKLLLGKPVCTLSQQLASKALGGCYT